MATKDHCAYCFEVLVANLEGREPLSYHQVQESWRQYQSLRSGDEIGEDDGSRDDDAQDAEEEDIETDELESPGDLEDGLAGIQEQSSRSTASMLQPPSISRLQPPSPSTPSSSSTISTPSSLSTTSSQAALNTNSKSSSLSSFSYNSSPRSSSTALPPEASHPLFITWNTISPRGSKSLRGCIGTFDPQPLSSGLKSYALAAAYDDTRFPPISSHELPTLTNSTTLLTNFTPAKDPLDWTLGKHGIRISFIYHSKRYSATYLPDVAEEQGWTKEETLNSLMRKAGAGGARFKGWEAVRGKMEVVRYEGVKRTVGWREWREWRCWVRGEGV